MVTILVVVSAILVVFGTSLIKNVDWPDKVKNLIAVGLSLLAGTVGVYAMGGFNNVTDVLGAATVVYGAAQAVYQFIFKGSSLNEKISNWTPGGKDESVVDEPVEEPVVEQPTPEAPAETVVEETPGDHEAVDADLVNDVVVADETD
jgi:hypothetical protein